MTVDGCILTLVDDLKGLYCSMYLSHRGGQTEELSKTAV